MEWETENLFGNVDDDVYYKPILVKRYDHKAIRNESKEWKIQITMHVHFISSKDTGEIRTIFLWSDSKEIRVGNETDDIIKELFNSF